MHGTERAKTKARELIRTFKGRDYIFGLDTLPEAGPLAKTLGKRALLVTNLEQRDAENHAQLIDSLRRSGVEIVGQTPSARPNSPQEDVRRMREAVRSAGPDFLIAASGGSGIDAAKAAVVLTGLGGDLEDYFGVGLVTARLKQTAKTLLPLLAVQTASGSAAHLTKYSNITDMRTHQKKLIIDEAIVPPKSLFDYHLTRSMSPDFTCDGAFDGLSHCLEVYFGAPPDQMDRIEEIALTGVELILGSLEKALSDLADSGARESLGLATDLGGYAIMVGGTNGPHLTSFSLVDVLSHGRACAILTPYYTAFFAPAIQRQLRELTRVLTRYGLVKERAESLGGVDLGLAVAQGMITLEKRVGFPTALKNIDGISESHIARALRAAKDPQLESKLKNMPIPLAAEQVDDYMGPVLEAAFKGDFSLIKPCPTE